MAANQQQPMEPMTSMTGFTQECAVSLSYCKTKGLQRKCTGQTGQTGMFFCLHFATFDPAKAGCHATGSTCSPLLQLGACQIQINIPSSRKTHGKQTKCPITPPTSSLINYCTSFIQLSSNWHNTRLHSWPNYCSNQGGREGGSSIHSVQLHHHIPHWPPIPIYCVYLHQQLSSFHHAPRGREGGRYYSY